VLQLSMQEDETLDLEIDIMEVIRNGQSLFEQVSNNPVLKTLDSSSL
jgi:hypothetical protein